MVFLCFLLWFVYFFSSHHLYFYDSAATTVRARGGLGYAASPAALTIPWGSRPPAPTALQPVGPMAPPDLHQPLPPMPSTIPPSRPRLGARLPNVHCPNLPMTSTPIVFARQAHVITYSQTRRGFSKPGPRPCFAHSCLSTNRKKRHKENYFDYKRLRCSVSKRVYRRGFV